MKVNITCLCIIINHKQWKSTNAQQQKLEQIQFENKDHFCHLGYLRHEHIELRHVGMS